MFNRIITHFVLGMLCLFNLVGCGTGDSNTNGQLTLVTSATDLTGGLFSVDAVATYANAAKTGALNGFPITITMTVHKKDGTILGTKSYPLSANSLGVVGPASLQLNQISETLYVDVTASSGGLSDHKTVTIPSNVAMVSSPLAVAFPLDSTANATQTVTISGGLAPYNATIDAAHIADIRVSINGNAIILTKLKNSVTNGPAILATLTVTDSSGATPITVNVSYN